MTERQEKLLEIVVKEYVRSAEPISSGKICNKYDIDCSSATIRNDLHHLTEEGFLQQLHTSGGRVPTDKAYRFIVDSIMGDKTLDLEDQKKIQSEYFKLKAEYKRLAKLTSRLLAKMTKGVAVGGSLDESDSYETGISQLLKEPEYEKVDSITEVVDLIEYFDEHLPEVYEKLPNNKEQIFIGQENIYGKVKNHSVILSGYELRDGERGLLALIGPKRMNYKKNLTVIRGIIESITKRNLLPVITFVSIGSSLIIITN